MPETDREEVTIDEALEKSVGEFGRGQLKIYLMVNLVWLVTALQIYSMLFVEWDPLASGQWQCTDLNDKQCSKFAPAGKGPENQKKVLCKEKDQWEWTDRSGSIVSEFELACENWKVTIMRSVFFIGQLLGSGLFGYMADKTGRQKALVVSATISAFGTALGAFSPNFWTYFSARAFTGLGSGGQVVASFVLWIEFMGPSKRGKLGIAAQFLFTAGECLLAGLAWVFPSWRNLSLAVGILSFMFVIICTWIPESPRWLLVKSRKGEATSVLAALASANKTKLPEFPLLDTASHGNTDRMLLEVFQQKRTRKALFLVLATWFSVCGVFHAPVLMLESIAGDNKLRFLLLATIEVPVYFLLILLIDSVGRRALYAWGLTTGGACCLLMWILPKMFVLPLALVGKLAISGAFAVAFPYTTEIFSTSVRASTLGASSLVGRIGVALAALIANSTGIVGGAVPVLVLGLWGIVAGFLAVGLPETAGMPLADSIEGAAIAATSRRRFMGWSRKKCSQSYAKITDGDGSQC